MSRVKICPKCGSIAEWDSYFGGTRCTRCDFVERPKPTNYDRIIRKTPEELASIFSKYVDCRLCPVERWHCDRDPAECKGVWLDWLKQEATDADN